MGILMKKPKILLVTAFAHRDMGTCFILAGLLERLGHECMITNSARAQRSHLRKWRPDAVFWMRLNNAKRGIGAHPSSLHYYCPGEGGEQHEFAEENDLAKDEKLFSAIKRAFLWGKKSLDNIAKTIEELGDKSHLFNRDDWVEGKIHLVGHPRMDIARFVDDVENKTGKVRIGLIGSFSVINHASKKSLLSRVLNTPAGSTEPIPVRRTPGYVHGIFQLNLANVYSRLISELDRGKYHFSLRPYPEESRDEYNSMRLVKEGVLDIDKCYDFANWLAQQDLLIAPTSSTVPQIAMGGKPYILVDFVDNMPEQSVYRISLSKIFHSHMPENVPKTYEQLLKLIENYGDIPVTSEGMDELLDYVYKFSPSSVSSDNPPSALATMAGYISDDLKNPANRASGALSLPGWLMRLVDRNISVDRDSYNDFNFAELEAGLEAEFSPVVNNILNASRITKV